MSLSPANLTMPVLQANHKCLNSPEISILPNIIIIPNTTHLKEQTRLLSSITKH